MKTTRPWLLLAGLALLAGCGSPTYGPIPSGGSNLVCTAVTAAGAPLAGVTMKITGNRGQDYLTTGADGTCSLTNIASGPYIVFAYALKTTFTPTIVNVTLEGGTGQAEFKASN
jgi:hypothetical protein